MNKEFNPTAIESYLTCPRKFYYSLVKGIQPKADRVALSFGTAMHAAGAAWYGKLGDEVALKAFCDLFPEVPSDVEDKYRTQANGVATLKAYFKLYKDDTIDSIDYLEQEFRIPMPNGTVLVIKPDRIRKTSTGIIPTDMKTTAMPLTSMFFNQYENSFQLTGYLYGANHEFKETCDSVVIDALKVPLSTTGKTENFVRRSFFRTEKQIKDWEDTYIKTTDKMLCAKCEADFTCNQQGCAKPFVCDYLDLCKYGKEHPLCKEKYHDVAPHYNDRYNIEGV
jgi:CRISPR/Cas system-associated exonuclease Cas4 (RecB family)